MTEHDEELPTVEVDAPEEAQPSVEAETAEQPVEQAPVERPWSDEAEETARAFGWKSPDEWKGDHPPGYIDNPEEFIARAERFPAVKALQRKLSEVTEQSRRTEEALQETFKRQRERERAEYDRQLRAIAIAQRKAVEEADTERFDRLEEVRAGMKPPEPAPPVPDGDRPSPEEVAETQAAHDWMQNPYLMQQAGGIIDAALKMGVAPVGYRAQADYAAKELRKLFPGAFPARPKPPAPKVDGGGLASAGMKKSAFDRLPDFAKATFKRQVAQGIFEDSKADREEFADAYENG